MPFDRSRYPSNWDAISYEIRAVRAEWRCECRGECGCSHDGARCGRRHGNPIDPPGTQESLVPRLVVLTVAHLDHDPANCDPGNLRAMCQRCHLRYDAKHHARNATRTRAAKRGQGILPGVTW